MNTLIALLKETTETLEQATNDVLADNTILANLLMFIWNWTQDNESNRQIVDETVYTIWQHIDLIRKYATEPERN